MPSFFVIQGRDQGCRFDLDEAVLSLGRVASNIIQLHDTEVSREHAVLLREDNTFTLRDLNSSNGTYVNGEPITSFQLASGDQVQVGKTLLLFTGVAGPADDLTEQISFVPSHVDEESRIVHTMGRPEELDLLGPAISANTTPRLARARGNLQVMYRTALAVSHTLDIDQLLHRIMDLIFEWVEADRGCIMLKHPETEKLSPKVRRHRNADKSDEKIAISQSILEYVLTKNEGVLTSDAKDDGRWDPTKSIVNFGVREAICVPMHGRYSMVGVIYIDTSTSPLRATTSPQFTPEHLKLMVAIAHQAALAIEDTNYYKAMVQAERLAAVGQTIASLSHHIKNVLQGVRGGSYLIELGLEDHTAAIEQDTFSVEKATKAVDMIQKGWKIVERNQERITTLVMDMLTFSKEREPEQTAANLCEVAAEAVELLQAHAAGLGVALRYTPCDSMPMMLFDPEGLSRAVLNIVTNAIDACDQRDDGDVTVDVHFLPEQALAQVVVIDNGCGIEPADMEQIFKIFVSRKGGRGTGLGLSVSEKVLKEHGGKIKVDSIPGEGSIFTLEFPAILIDETPEENSTANTQHA